MTKFMFVLFLLIVFLGFVAIQTSNPGLGLIAVILTKLFFICIPIWFIVLIFKAAVRTAKREWEK